MAIIHKFLLHEVDFMTVPIKLHSIFIEKGGFGTSETIFNWGRVISASPGTIHRDYKGGSTIYCDEGTESRIHAVAESLDEIGQIVMSALQLANNLPKSPVSSYEDAPRLRQPGVPFPK